LVPSAVEGQAVGGPLQRRPPPSVPGTSLRRVSGAGTAGWRPRTPPGEAIPCSSGAAQALQGRDPSRPGCDPLGDRGCRAGDRASGVGDRGSGARGGMSYLKCGRRKKGGNVREGRVDSSSSARAGAVAWCGRTLGGRGRARDERPHGEKVRARFARRRGDLPGERRAIRNAIVDDDRKGDEPWLDSPPGRRPNA
jgi:hypothetical protein